MEEEYNIDSCFDEYDDYEDEEEEEEDDYEGDFNSSDNHQDLGDSARDFTIEIDGATKKSKKFEIKVAKNIETASPPVIVINNNSSMGSVKRQTASSHI